MFLCILRLCFSGGQKILFKRLEYNCQSWPDVSAQHIPISKRCYGIPAPSTLSTNRKRQSGIVE